MFSFIYGSLISTKVEKYKKKSNNNLVMLLIFCVLVSSVTQVFQSPKSAIITNSAFVLCLLSLLIILFSLQLSKFQFLGDLNESMNQDVYNIKDSSFDQSVDLLSKQCQVNKQKSHENQKIVEKIQNENKINFASNDIKITNNTNKIEQNTQGIKMNHQNNLNNYDQIVKNQLALNDLQNQNKNIQEDLSQLGSSGSDISPEKYNELKDKITENSEGINVLKDNLNQLPTKNDLDNFSTKEDLNNLATKNDLDNFSTKEDLNNLATKNDLDKFATMDDFNLFHGGVMNNSTSIIDLKENVQTNSQGIQDNSSKITELINNSGSSNTAQNYDMLLSLLPKGKADKYYDFGNRNNSPFLSKLSNNQPEALYNDDFETANYTNGYYTNYTPKGLISECLIRLSDFNNTKLINSINKIIESSGFLNSVAHRHIKYLHDNNLLTSVALKDYIAKNPYSNKYIKLAERLKTQAIDSINRSYEKNQITDENIYATNDGALFKDALLTDFATYADYFNSSILFQSTGNEIDLDKVYDGRNKLHSLNPNKSLKAQYLIHCILGGDVVTSSPTDMMNYVIRHPNGSSYMVYDPIRMLMNYYMGTKNDIKNDVNLLHNQFITDIKETITKPLNNIQNLLKTKVSTNEDFTRIDALSSISMADGVSELDLLYDISKELKKYIKLQYSLKEIVSLDIMQSKNLQLIAEHCLSEREYYNNALQKNIDYVIMVRDSYNNKLISQEKYQSLTNKLYYEQSAIKNYIYIYGGIFGEITAKEKKTRVKFEDLDFNAITIADWMADYFTAYPKNDRLKQAIYRIKPIHNHIGVYKGERLIPSEDVSSFYQAQLSENIGYMKYLINKIEAVLTANKYEPKFVA